MYTMKTIQHLEIDLFRYKRRVIEKYLEIQFNQVVTGITAVQVSLMWHVQDTSTLQKSADQLRGKQSRFAIHSSLYINILNEILSAITHSRNKFPKS